MNLNFSNKLFFFSILLFSTGFCCSQKIKKEKTDIRSWKTNANIFEIIPSQYPDKGGFNSITNHRSKLKKLFINTVSLLPVYLLENESDSTYTGNPYLASDYKKINPALGTEKEFSAMLDSLHKIKIKVILEFDFGSTSMTHEWIKSKPEYYKAMDSTSKLFPRPNHLNLDNPNLQKELLHICSYWLKEYDIDGLMIRGIEKADAAWLTSLATLITTDNSAIFICDAKPENITSITTPVGLLNRALVDLLINIEKDSTQIKNFWPLIENINSLPSPHYFVNFTHDVNVEYEHGSMNDNFDYHPKTMAIISHYVNGVPLIFNGQESPLFEKINFKSKTPLNALYQYHHDFYRALILHRFYNEAMQNKKGGTTTNMVENPCVIGLKKSFGNQYSMILVNLCENSTTYQVKESIMFTDELFTHVKLNFDKDKVLQIGGYQVLTLTNKY